MLDIGIRFALLHNFPHLQWPVIILTLARWSQIKLSNERISIFTSIIHMHITNLKFLIIKKFGWANIISLIDISVHFTMRVLYTVWIIWASPTRDRKCSEIGVIICILSSFTLWNEAAKLRGESDEWWEWKGQKGTAHWAKTGHSKNVSLPFSELPNFVKYILVIHFFV